MTKILQVFLLTFLIGPIYATPFSNATFKGNYAYLLTGLSSIVLANESNAVATGIITADGNGGVNGSGSIRSANVTCIVQITGTYSINANGSGNISSIANTNTPGCVSGVLDLNLVVANNGQVIAVASAENDYMSGTLTRQGKSKFSLKDISGSYSLNLQGPSSIVNATSPYTVGLALLSADGQGNLIGSGNFRSYGVNCLGTIAGGIQLNSNGSGNINLNFSSTSPWCAAEVVNLSIALINANNGVVANSENDLMHGTISRLTFK